MQDNIPPHSLEAEQSVLGAVMLDCACFPKIKLLAEDFYFEKHSLIFRGMKYLSEKGEKIDLVTLSNLLKAYKKLDYVGGSIYLVELAEVVPSASHVANYAKIVKEKSNLRHMIQLADEIKSMATTEESENEIQAKAIEEFTAIKTANKNMFIEAETVLHTLFESSSELSRLDAIPFGIPYVDELTGGIFPGQLVVVGADTGCGKSEALRRISLEASKLGKKIVYFDLENDTGEILNREIAAIMSQMLNRRVRMSEIMTKQIFDEYPEEIGKAYVEASTRVKNIIFYDNKKIPTVEEFEQSLITLDEKKDIVLVDHLHYFDMGNKDLHDEIGRIMRRIKTLTRERRVPVVVASHLRKRNKNNDPGEEDLYGSSNIAKEASTVVLFSRKILNPFNTLIQVEKNRMNSTRGKILGYFDVRSGGFTSYGDVPEEGDGEENYSDAL